LPLSILASLLLCTAIVVAYAVRVVRSGRARHARLGSSPGSELCPGWLVEAFYSALVAPGRALARMGIDPDALTILGAALSIASLPLLATGRFPAGAICVGAGGALDALDGVVARARGRASAAGAVLDSFLDRISDAAPLVGLALFYRERVGTLVIPLAALVASSLVSYARARADVHGLALPNGVMRRHERVAYLILGLLLGPVVPGPGALRGVAYPATLAAIGVIAAGGFVAAFVLVARTRAALSAAGPKPAEAPPKPSLGRAVH
jgi:CDP-diacylglycerol--glycerol-3-phosphate 3-phosphatidyltransferase